MRSPQSAQERRAHPLCGGPELRKKNLKRNYKICFGLDDLQDSTENKKLRRHIGEFGFELI
jgi:hypothetical protein